MAAASLLLPDWEGRGFVVQNEMKITQWGKKKKEGYKPNFGGTILMQCKVIYIFCAPITHVC